MAAVWRATLHGAGEIQFPVAIKMLKPEHQPNADYLAMLHEEVRIGASLRHPHVVNVIDFIEHDGAHGLVMEWVEGASLLELLLHHIRQRRALAWHVVAHVAIGVLRGLQVAHQRTLEDGTPAPIVHRDVSPSNILLGDTGAVKLADFGVARARDRLTKLTAPNVVKGKVSYLAPELSRGREATPQSDLFSLACTMWEALAGKKLFQGANDTDVLLAIRRGFVPRLDELRPELPDELVAIVHGALAQDSAQRPGSAREVITELNRILRHDGPGIDAYDAIAEAVHDVVAGRIDSRIASPFEATQS